MQRTVAIKGLTWVGFFRDNCLHHEAKPVSAWQEMAGKSIQDLAAVEQLFA